MNLPEIAADVAQALGPQPLPDVSSYVVGNTRLPSPDGSNLTDPYWFFRCCEWLNEQGVGFDSPRGVCKSWAVFKHPKDPEGLECEWAIVLPECDFALAPAALVSAVWRKQRQEKAK